jgi:hypothetical protein
LNERDALPATLIEEEARLLHGLERPPGRNAELGREVARLNAAVSDAARELGFDDQPGDFLALLITLREREGSNP